jgi:hypothetical protein
MDSIKGVVVGLVLFLASFVVLWWNEGRVDMSKVAEASIPVDAAAVDSTADGRFVSVTGTLASDEIVGDPQFLKADAYIMLNRVAEMYAWNEEKSTKTKKKLGGGKRSETTYSYSKEWTERPENSSSFKKPEGHTNPSPLVTSQSFRVRQATIGSYRFDPQSAHLPRPSPLHITDDSYIPFKNARLEGDYIFSGNGTLQNPEVGDTRISFRAVRSGTTATLFGTLNGDAIEPYFYKGEKRLYRAIAGPREAAIAQMASEHRLITWLLRVVGFLMMWIGLGLFFGPINTVLDVIPLLGGVSRMVTGLAMFAVALSLSLVTIVVSMIAHNPLLLIGSIVVVFGVVWAVGRRGAKQKTIAPRGDADVESEALSEKVETGKAVDEGAIHTAPKEKSASAHKIRFQCEECGKQYTVTASLAGRKGKCKECGHKMIIPAHSTG